MQLNSWLNQHFDENVSPQLISGDASFRRYFRVWVRGVSYIAVDSPPNLINIAPFIEIAAAYSQQGLSVPEVIADNLKLGFMLLSDLGDVQLLSVLSEDNIEMYYSDALSLLKDIAKVTATAVGTLPLYDDEFVMRELTIFTQWLLSRHLGMPLDDVTSLLDATFLTLINNAKEQPKAGMHRDFHSRNLMLQEQSLSVIDFQDAVIGPITYDAVSLLRDCYVRWPDHVVDKLMQQHYRQCINSRLLASDISLSQYRRWFDLMGLQRHIKAAGIFARLNYRDNKPAYMADIPLTLEYIRDISIKYDELKTFSHWIGAVIIPAIEAAR